MLLLERERTVVRKHVPVQIASRVSPELKVQIAALAADMGLKDSDVIRQMLEYAMPEFKDRAERYKTARRAGEPTEEDIEAEMHVIAGDLAAGRAVEIGPDDIAGVRGQALGRLMIQLYDRNNMGSPDPMPKPLPPPTTKRERESMTD